MCGFVGLSGERGAELVERLLPTLEHRGPDDHGIWSNQRLAFGHRRLAILGLDRAGRQPMRTSDSLLVFNGEIYNYLELADELEAQGVARSAPIDRRFDSAVLLAALETWGRDALPKLNGMFAFAWYRPQQRRVLLARDRFGQKPLFFGTPRLDDGSRPLAFGSELRLFTRLPGGPPPPDPLGVARYLVYDGMPATRTVYRDVEKVAAGSWVEFDEDGVEKARGRYWDPLEAAINCAASSPTILDLSTAGARFDELLCGSLRLRLRSDVPVGLLLSGGIDSSLLAEAWNRGFPSSPLRTFTVGFDEASYDERQPAREMAEAANAEHHETIVAGADLERELEAVWDHLSEPFADPSIVPTSLVCRLARQHVTVALGGDGADELQAGYDPFRAWRPARALESLLGGRLAGSLAGLTERLLPVDDRNLSPRFKAHHMAQGLRRPREERVQSWMASYPVDGPSGALAVLDPDLVREIDPDEILEPSRNAYRRALEWPAGSARANPHAAELRAQIHTWIATYLECSILTKIDRASMMHSLELRSPFLDPDLSTFLLALPPQLVFHGGRGKVLMREVARTRIPPQIAARPKKGLGVPQASWLRTVLRERMESCLEQSRTSGWFRHDAIDGLWQDHLDHRADHRKALWCFLFAHPFRS